MWSRRSRPRCCVTPVNTDFIATLHATVVTRPDMTNRQFAEWITESEVFERYPGGAGYGYIQIVPAAQLDD
ncbi:hypothetical protein Plo01_46190 [Planobispora longispora]|uniref:Uncharacterized protein n=2 Tax=Planobispora longispora TaxID=28887 RepID=A0A8J3RP40_9ACTN|nr:hypothetical protein GCM10020093_020850 [Planobispora longispora]GIH78190.1 hypothetical protein Plo01_46190 [Planobispora longispora]